MKPKIRLVWMQLHTYFACLFLPLTLLYIATGVLYLFDIEGKVHEIYAQEVSLPNGWPEDETESRALIEPIVRTNKLGEFPSDYYHEAEYISWYGRTREILLWAPDQDNISKLQVLEHGLWHQLLLIHNGHGGILFWVFGVLLGLSIVFSMISGLIMAVTLPRFRRPAIVLTLIGLITPAAIFVIGL